MQSGIYKITNPEGKIYIGCTSDLERRIKDYERGNIRTQPLILESWRKHGWDSHIFEILEYTEDLILKEKYYIKKYDSYYKGLNGNKGGNGVKKHTLNTRLKMGIAGKKNKGKRAISHRKGKKLSEEHRLNISKGKKGLPNPKNAKAILQYDKDNTLIAEHPSIEQAAISVNGNPTAITNALRKGGEATSSSYIWKYKKL